MKVLVSVGVAAACAVTFGGLVVADFESASELPSQRTHDAHWRVCVTNVFASSGCRSLYFGAAWQKGLYEYPAVTVPVPESLRDWRNYDRLAFDVVSKGERFDKVFVRLPGSDNWGVTKTFYAPANAFLRVVLPLGEWPKSVDPANVRQIEIFSSHPECVELFMDRFVLLKAGEPLPPEPVFDDASARALNEWRAESDSRIAGRRTRLMTRLNDGMRRAGIRSETLVLGQASSMSRVMPRSKWDDHEEVGSVEGLGVRLAKGEREGVQLVVTPIRGDVSDVRVTASDLKDVSGNVLPSATVSCEPVGYVKIDEPGRYAVGMAHRRPLPGWYPDPILSFLGKVDVRDGEVQAFWIRVTCPETQTAGTYSGRLTVSSAGHADVHVPFSVRVNDFVLPRTSPLPLAISFNPEPWTDWNLISPSVKAAREGLWKDPEAPVNVWKRHRMAWGSFLADYYITMTSLYNGNFSAVQWDVLQRLKAEGRLGLFNIGYWHPLYDRWLPNDGGVWRANTLQRIRDNYAKAKELGLADHVYSYGCDEAPTNLFPAISRALGRLRREFPDLTIGTTTYDFSFGEDSPLGGVSFFTPTIERFTPEMAQRARTSGRKVWWYFACDEKAPWPNMFIEGLPIEGRLLTGAMAQRMQPDGLLYYQVAIWNAARPIMSGPYTDWVAQAWCGDNGDGMWTAVGPDGVPLPTIRLENFRDGLDDLAYARILSARLAQCCDDSCDWAVSARAALAVPQSVMKTMTDYTNDPSDVLAWRNELADLIERMPQREPKISVFSDFIRSVSRQTGVSLEDAAEQLYALGVRGFDAGVFEKDLDRLAAGSLKPVNLYYFPTFEGDDGGERVDRRALDAAARLGVRQIMTIPPGFSKDGDEEAEFRRILARFKRFVAMARARGITVTTEDFGGVQNACSRLDYLKRMLDEIPDLRLALDSGNLYYAGRGEDILEMLSYAGSRIVHVHLKDQSHSDCRRFVSLGEGAVPNRQIVQKTWADGYSGWYTLENAVGDTYADTARQVAVLKSWLAARSVAQPRCRVPAVEFP